MKRCPITFLLALSIFITAALPAMAQPPLPPPAPSPPTAAETTIDETDYKAVYERARARANAKDWLGALEDYRRAFTIAQGEIDFIAAANHARAAIEVEQWAEAGGMIRLAIARMPPTQKDYAIIRTRFEKRLSEAEAHIGKVTVAALPAGVEIVVDGKSYGRAPLAQPIYLTPGRRMVHATLSGHEAQQITVEAVAGTAVTISVTLTPSGIAGVTPSGRKEGGGAEGMMDGALLGGGIAMVGLGVAGLAAAIVLGVTVGDRLDSAEQLRATNDAQASATYPCGAGLPLVTSASCTDLLSDEREAIIFRNAAIGVGVAAGVLLTAGIATLVAGGGDDDKKPQVGIMAGPGHLGVSLNGTF